MNSNSSPEYADLVDILEQLFPDSAIQCSSRQDRNSIAFRLVPNRTHPRMIVPSDSPRAAADAVRRPSASDGAFRRYSRAGLASLLLSRVGNWLMPYELQVSEKSDSIVRYLSEVIGEPTRISVTVGSRRANRKPVLNVHTLNGAEVGFAKIGLSQLARELVDYEGRVLGRLAQSKDSPFETPIRLHSGQWLENEVLVMTALRSDQPPSPTSAALRQAMAAIASGNGIQESQVGSSPWLIRLYKSARSLEGSEGESLLLLLDHFTAAYGDYVLPFGAWHGDFGPWNVNFSGDKPMIWDWERYQTDVPLGIDVVHYTAHRVLRRIDDLPRARQILYKDAYEALGTTVRLTGSIPTPPTLNAIISAYLLIIAVRFTVDSVTTQDNDSLRALASWYKHVLTDRLTEVSPHMSGGRFL